MTEPKKILLVTSNEDMKQDFKSALVGYDVKLFHRKTYSTAIELIQGEQFDLVITDLFLRTSGDEESFESYLIELNTIENDLRLYSPIKDSLIRYRQYIHNKAEEKMYPLGSRLAIESKLMMNETILLINIEDTQFNDYDFEEFLADVALYYIKYGHHLFYSSLGEFPQSAVDYLVGIIAIAVQLEKMYESQKPQN